MITNEEFKLLLNLLEDRNQILQDISKRVRSIELKQDLGRNAKLVVQIDEHAQTCPLFEKFTIKSEQTSNDIDDQGINIPHWTTTIQCSCNTFGGKWEIYDIHNIQALYEYVNNIKKIPTTPTKEIKNITDRLEP